MLRILIVTGEASGDLHGANLAKALWSLRPDMEILGMGGSSMRAAGVRILYSIEGHDVVGLIRLGQLCSVLRTYLGLARFLRKTPLDAIVFVDYPGFNLRMARLAARAGHRVVYYIAPQVWAWYPGRMGLIARAVHRMLVILPFEAELYRKAGVPCDFVGHPLLDAMAPIYNRDDLLKQLGIDAASSVVGLFPGSRDSEVRALLPVMLRAAKQLTRTRQGLKFVLAKASSVSDGLIEGLVARQGLDVRVLAGQPSEVMAACSVLWVASGTATLQAAILGVPMVILYRVSWLTYWLARRLIRVPWIGLVNIVAGRRIVPELIQHEATPQRLCEEAAGLLDSETEYRAMLGELRKVRATLGEPGASRRAAALVLAECPK